MIFSYCQLDQHSGYWYKIGIERLGLYLRCSTLATPNIIVALQQRGTS